MARFMTSIILAILLADTVSAAVVSHWGDAHEPPRGVRRMIETLEKKYANAVESQLAGQLRRVATGDPDRAN